MVTTATSYPEGLNWFCSERVSNDSMKKKYLLMWYQLKYVSETTVLNSYCIRKKYQVQFVLPPSSSSSERNYIKYLQCCHSPSPTLFLSPSQQSFSFKLISLSRSLNTKYAYYLFSSVARKTWAKLSSKQANPPVLWWLWKGEVFA